MINQLNKEEDEVKGSLSMLEPDQQATDTQVQLEDKESDTKSNLTGNNVANKKENGKVNLPSALVQEQEINNSNENIEEENSDSDSVPKTKQTKKSSKKKKKLSNEPTNNENSDTESKSNAISVKKANKNKSPKRKPTDSDDHENSSSKKSLRKSKKSKQRKQLRSRSASSRSRSKSISRASSFSRSRSRTPSRSRSRSKTPSSRSSRSRTRSESFSRSRSSSRSSYERPVKKKKSRLNKKTRKNGKTRPRSKSRSSRSYSRSSRSYSRSSGSRSRSRTCSRSRSRSWSSKSRSTSRSYSRSRSSSRSSYISRSRSRSSRSRSRSRSNSSSRSDRSLSSSPKRRSLYRNKKARSSSNESRSRSRSRNSKNKSRNKKRIRSRSPKLTSSARQRTTPLSVEAKQAFYSYSNITNKYSLNPTAAVSPAYQYPFSKLTRDRYTYIRNPKSNLVNQQQLNQATFLNRTSKNPAFFFNRQNTIPMPDNPTTITNQTFLTNGQSPPSAQSNLKAKSAILSHLNLNNKAREELEKRKLKAKQEKQAEEAAAAAAAAAQVQNSQEEERTEENTDNTPAIPITSYTSYNNDSDDDEDESENEEESKKLNKHKLGDKEDVQSEPVKKAKLELKTLSDDDDDEEENESKTYLNVFSKLNKKKNSTLALNSEQAKDKQPVKKAPIIKAGQLHTKERVEEIVPKLSFIGPKLPYYNKQSNTASSDSNRIPKTPIDSTPSVKFDKDTQKFVLNENEPSETAKNDESTGQNDENSNTKINYSKDELAKYENLLKMSQMYAKYNQVSVVNVGPNGVAEISMVELDNSIGMIEQKPSDIEVTNNFVVEQSEVKNATTSPVLEPQTSQVSNSHIIEPQVLIEKPITLPLNELEGMSVPSDVTLKHFDPNPQQQSKINSEQVNLAQVTSPSQHFQAELQHQQTQQQLNHQPQQQQQHQLHNTTIILPQAHHQPQHLAHQQVQFIPIQNHAAHLIQMPTNQASQQLLNLQLNQLIHPTTAFQLNHLNQLQTSFIQAPTTLTTQNFSLQAALQQQQALVVQQQQNQLAALQNHLPIQYIPANAQQQFIQYRPGIQIAQTLGQPQFILNSPFYRILPQ